MRPEPSHDYRTCPMESVLCRSGAEVPEARKQNQGFRYEQREKNTSEAGGRKVLQILLK